MNYNYPPTWVVAALEDLIVFALGGDWGKDPTTHDPDYVEVRCIRASEIKSWKDEKGHTAAIRKIKKASLEKRNLTDGDILVEISGGGPDQPVGRTVLIDKEVLGRHRNTPKICTNFFRLIRPATDVDSEYLNLYLQHFYQVGGVGEFQGGSNNLRNLKFNDYLELTVPLPPVNEQRRIVAKIEALFSELDKGVEALKTAREQLKVYRQAVLKHAFEGRLTAQWREENKGRLESPEQLLARIQQEREARYQGQLMKWEAAVQKWENKGGQGRKPAKPKRNKPLPRLQNEEIDVLPQLPKEWGYTRLAEIAYIGSGMSVSKARKLHDPIEVPYLRVANVQRGALVLDEIKTMAIEKNMLSELALEKWDVLFNEGGDRDKLGRGWIWEGQVDPCITQNHVFRASPYLKNEFHSKFISHWGNTFGRDYFEKGGKQTTNLASINKTVLSMFPVPVPSLEEQEKIIEHIDDAMSVIDSFEREIEQGLAKSETLRQSILKKAFSGQLVPQDPTDEPASVLLERIRNEKAQQTQPARRTRRKKTA